MTTALPAGINRQSLRNRPRNVIRGAGGFSLLEILMAIVFAGFVVAMAGQLFNMSTKMITQSQATQAASERRAWAMKKMRQDVWAATQVSLSEGQGIELRQSGGKKIIWRWDEASATLTRELDPAGPLDDALLTYQKLGADCAFALKQGCVTVTFKAEHQQTTLTLASLRTAMGGQP